MLATSFSLNKPNTHKKHKNAGAYNIICQYHGIPFTVSLFFVINTSYSCVTCSEYWY